MEKGKLRTIKGMLLLTAFLFPSLGCNDLPSDSKTEPSRKFQSFGYSNDENRSRSDDSPVMYSSSPVNYSRMLPEGCMVEAISASIVLDTISVRLRYNWAGGEQSIRTYKIYDRYSGLLVMPDKGAPLFGYKLDIINGSFLSEHIFNRTDDLLMTMSWTDSLMNIGIGLNGHDMSTNFAGELDLGKARNLFDQYSSNSPSRLQGSDSLLLDKYLQMVNFVSNHQLNINDMETRIASTLMTDEEFIKTLPQGGQVMPLQMCGIIGDIAAVATLSCFFGPVAAPLCIPATGIATACAIAGLLSRIFG